MTATAGILDWHEPRPWHGNEMKYTSLLEIAAPLDTSRLHISLPINGREHYVVDGEWQSASASEYFVFNPGQQASAEGQFEKSVEGFCFFITAETLRKAAQALGQPIGCSLDSPFDFDWSSPATLAKNYHLQENQMGKYLERLRQVLLHQPSDLLTDWDQFYFALAAEFLHTHHQIQLQTAAIPATKPATRQEIYQRISRCHRFLLENFAEPFSLEDLEKIAFLSKFHILRLYRQVYGLTPYQHLLQLRVGRAKELLAKDFSPTEVAFQLSFADRRSFAKVFKKIAGMPPNGFRESGMSGQ